MSRLGTLTIVAGMAGALLALGACGGSKSSGNGNNNNNVNTGNCGNGAIDGTESCDASDLGGNTCVSLNLGGGTLGCDNQCDFDFSGCTTQPNCGNGTIEGAEICDATNLGFADCADAGFSGGGTLACAGDCTWDTSGCVVGACGDGQIDGAGGEQCDDGNTTSGDGCDSACQLEIPANCGDGTVDAGEDCDDGAQNSDVLPDACRSNCVDPHCGDGVADLASGETCDDGNTAAGDGCDASCAIEPPASCGDGVLDMGEECDDGNTSAGDGCDPACQLEVVGTACGDNTVDPTAQEKCDPPDGMPADGDGCNATCNLTGQVTTLHSGSSIGGLASDNTYLWMGIGDCQGGNECGIARIDIAACNASPGGAACQPTFVTGGAGACSCGNPAPALVDGPGGTATYGFMGPLTTDGVTIWFGGRNTLREYDIATGITTTVAGQEGSCAAIDGNGTTTAYFHGLRAPTFWNGDVYLLDGCENVLRRYDPLTQNLVTIAGTRNIDTSVTQQPPYTCSTSFSCTSAPLQPGFGLAAQFGSPRYLTADNAGNLYFIDTNGQAIWRYNTVTTYAEILISGSAPGTGNGPYSDGDANTSNIGRPRGIVSDGTSVYFGEQSYATIRQLEIATAFTTTFVGVMGCEGNNTGQAQADGLGADTQQLYCRGGGGPPAGVPVFDTLFGGLSYHFATRSIYAVDGQTLRRIE